jgi:transposase
MKNRYLKGAHISEKKVFELLRLFSDDLNATQIAEISGISRITVNAYLKMIRRLLAEHSDEESRSRISFHTPIISNEHQHEHLNGHAKTNNGNGHLLNGNGLKHGRPIYGITEVNSSVYAIELQDYDPEMVHDWLKKKYLPGGNDHILCQFNALADFNTLTLYRTGLNDRSGQRDGLDYFWAMIRSRMTKFRGLNSNTLFLHVKETEFRYNNRDKEMFDMLLKLVQKRPLHYNKLD